MKHMPEILRHIVRREADKTHNRHYSFYFESGASFYHRLLVKELGLDVFSKKGNIARVGNNSPAVKGDTMTETEVKELRAQFDVWFTELLYSTGSCQERDVLRNAKEALFESYKKEFSSKI